MKLNFGKKLVLFMHWLFSLLGCTLAVMLCVWPNVVAKQFSSAYDAIGKRNMDIIGVALLAIYVALAIATVIIIFSGNGRRSERGFITVDSSDTGKTRIAVGAVEQMIRQAVHGVEGIADMKTSITNNEDAISIDARVAIVNGAHVPTVTMNIQRSIRSYIELNCGVAVRDVSVSVHSLTNEEGNHRGKKKFAAQSATMPTPVEPANMDTTYSGHAHEAKSLYADAAAPAAQKTDAPTHNDARRNRFVAQDEQYAVDEPEVQNEQYAPDEPEVQNEQYAPDEPEVQNEQYAPDEPDIQDEPDVKDAQDTQYASDTHDEPEQYNTKDDTVRIPDALIEADPTAKDPFGFHTDEH